MKGKTIRHQFQKDHTDYICNKVEFVDYEVIIYLALPGDPAFFERSFLTLTFPEYCNMLHGVSIDLCTPHMPHAINYVRILK